MWWNEETWDGRLVPYVIALRALIEGRLSPPEFNRLYAAAYLKDLTQWSDQAFAVLDQIHAMADDWDDDVDKGRSPDQYVGTDELVREARVAVDRLRLISDSGTVTDEGSP